MRFKNIVVSGDVGTGTSTLAIGLAKKLYWKHKSAGDIFRVYFRKNNIPLWNKSKIPDEFDEKIDNNFLDKMKNEEHIVFDSHYGGWFARNLSDIYRVLLTCDKDLAVKRIIDREHTHKEASGEIEERRKQLRAKFKKLYSDDNYENPKLFNLVIDTTKISIDETIKKAYVSVQSANL